MASNKEIILAFDAYGTLLSTDSISKQLARHFGEEKATTISTQWRRYQLEYTWRLNSMNKYIPFSTVTLHSLSHALSEAGVSLSQQEKESLMQAYDNLSLFPDVSPLFSHLEKSKNITPVIFSNGTSAMLSATLKHSSEISPYAHLFNDVVVVDDMPEGNKKFKPCPETYRHALEKVGKSAEGQEKDVWLISGNPFDITGAAAVGMRTCWVDRAGKGWMDGLMDGLEGEGWMPDLVVRGVNEVVESVAGFVKGEGAVKG